MWSLLALVFMGALVKGTPEIKENYANMSLVSAPHSKNNNQLSHVRSNSSSRTTTSKKPHSDLDAPAIANGLNVEQRESQPWAAYLSFSFGDLATSACTGTLIRDNFILTAAQCILDYSRGVASYANATLGGLNADVSLPGVVTMKCTQLYYHSGYKVESNGGYSVVEHDIGLVKLPTSIVRTDKIKPISLGVGDYHDRPATLVGFGEDDKRGTASGLLKYAVTQIRKDCICDWHWNCPNNTNVKTFIAGAMLCYGGFGTNGICGGDGGGPVIADDVNGNKVIIAVHSYADNRIDNASVVDYCPSRRSNLNSSSACDSNLGTTTTSTNSTTRPGIASESPKKRLVQSTVLSFMQWLRSPMQVTWSWFLPMWGWTSGVEAEQANISPSNHPIIARQQPMSSAARESTNRRTGRQPQFGCNVNVVSVGTSVAYHLDWINGIVGSK